jgi:hypothetical protein
VRRPPSREPAATIDARLPAARQATAHAAPRPAGLAGGRGALDTAPRVGR